MHPEGWESDEGDPRAWANAKFQSAFSQEPRLDVEKLKCSIMLSLFVCGVPAMELRAGRLHRRRLSFDFGGWLTFLGNLSPRSPYDIASTSNQSAFVVARL
jgi:hypothetical protein